MRLANVLPQLDRSDLEELERGLAGSEGLPVSPIYKHVVDALWLRFAEPISEWPEDRAESGTR
jgi:hypothetical protein